MVLVLAHCLIHVHAILIGKANNVKLLNALVFWQIILLKFVVAKAHVHNQIPVFVNPATLVQLVKYRAVLEFCPIPHQFVMV